IAFQEDYDFPIRKQPIALDPARLAEYEGVYQIADNRLRLIQQENDRLLVREDGAMPQPLLPEAPDLFFFDGDHTRTLRFIRDRQGVIVRQEVRDQDGAYLADRIPDSPETRELLSRQV